MFLLLDAGMECGSSDVALLAFRRGYDEELSDGLIMISRPRVNDSGSLAPDGLRFIALHLNSCVLWFAMYGGGKPKWSKR